MERLKPRAIEPSNVEGQVLGTVNGVAAWMPAGGAAGDYWTKEQVGDIPGADFVAAFEAALTPPPAP